MARVFVTDAMGMADWRIARVSDRGRADLLVHCEGSYGLARGEALWCLTDDREMSSMTVFFCSEGMAQLKVCFVPTRGEAGWVDMKHRLRGRLARR
jgi:hypothetical protein